MAGKYWREAASLMVVGRAATVNSKVASRDFEVLLLKRNEKGSFAGTHVFPGGVIDASDFSESWINVFKKCGYKSSDLQTEFRSKAPLPVNHDKSYSIPPEVGFRIAAIREAFEECGLLITQDFPYRDLSQHQLSEWQHSVHQDGSQFLKMFQEFGGCPAIRRLYEWSAWLTPLSVAKRRFNTAFFVTFIEKIPQIVVDDKEVVDVKASAPLKTLKQFALGDLRLPPPQVYELGRLLNFVSYEDLEKFARERDKKGMELIFPVLMPTSDGLLNVLPGDDLYPEKPDYNGEQEAIVLQESIEELRKQGKNFHRMEFRSRHDVDMIVNITPKYGQVVPCVTPWRLLKNSL